MSAPKNAWLEAERAELLAELGRVVRLANERICAILIATGRATCEFPLIASPLLAVEADNHEVQLTAAGEQALAERKAGQP